MQARMTRRRFLAAAVGTGIGLTVPLDLARLARTSAEAAGPDPATYFFPAGSTRLATLRALCARIVPTDTDSSGRVTSPGAADARAYIYVDRLLAAFSLPAAVADNPAVYLRGPYSGRNPFPDNATGEPSSTSPPDAFATGGQTHYLPLNALQQLSWRTLIEGTEVALGTKNLPPRVSARWAAQVRNGDLPSPSGAGGLHDLYNQGLDSFDSYAETVFGTHFAETSPTEQDLLIETAGSIVAGQIPGAPGAAAALFPTLVINTFQGTYGLPEYRGESSVPAPGPASPIWTDIGWDGDTQPLGSSIYDSELEKPPPGQMPNDGFGLAGVYQPTGYYREHRPVSYIDATDPLPDLSGSELAPWVAALEARGVLGHVGVRP